MEKCSRLGEKSALGFIINAMDGGGDTGEFFPHSDAEDFSRGARFIPGEVTLARRKGQCVNFVQNCNGQCCWYWLMPDGSRVYHWDKPTFDRLDGKSCPRCGNVNTTGKTITGFAKRDVL